MDIIRKTITILIAIIIVITACSCGHYYNQDIIIYSNLVKYKLSRSDSANEFSFNIEVLSPVRYVDFEFVSAEGVNTDNIEVTFTDDTFKEIAMKKIRNNYLLLIGIHCKTIYEYLAIDSIQVKINGELKNINFDTPIENTFFKHSDSEHFISQRNMPIYVFTTSFVGQNETDYDFSMEALSNITINQIYFNDFLDFSNEVVAVNKIPLGKLSDILPISLKEGDVLSIYGRIKLNFDDDLFMGNIYTNIIVNYEANNQSLTEYYPLTAAYIGNRNDAVAFVNEKLNLG